MGVISNNTGPVAPETSILNNNLLAVTQNIWLQLIVITRILEQAYGITDSDAAIRNSITINDRLNIT